MMQTAKGRGERLKGQILRSAAELTETTDRAKEYERSMASVTYILHLTNPKQ